MGRLDIDIIGLGVPIGTRPCSFRITSTGGICMCGIASGLALTSTSTHLTVAIPSQHHFTIFPFTASQHQAVIFPQTKSHRNRPTTSASHTPEPPPLSPRVPTEVPTTRPRQQSCIHPSHWSCWYSWTGARSSWRDPKHHLFAPANGASISSMRPVDSATDALLPPFAPRTRLPAAVPSASKSNGMTTTSRMPAQQVVLPHGQTYTVTPVFGGYTFKSTNLDTHHSAMPPGWTVVVQTEDEVDYVDESLRRKSKISVVREYPDDEVPFGAKTTISHRFTGPTVQSDSMFISSISMPSSSDFKGPTSPTRHIALMLWATLYWYFHKDAPNPHTLSEASSLTPESGRPKADWRIKIKREGIFKGKNTLQKLERMGLIASEDSCVGTDTDIRLPSGWSETFVSQRAFWQIDAKIFLFTLAQIQHSPFPAQSPYPSRPASPERGVDASRPSPRPSDMMQSPGILLDGLSAGISSPGGPFNSGSHLPTFYPPPPTQFTFTNHIRHPIRPKPPRQGEVFYTRYIPSLDSWLSFRIPSLSPRPVPHPHFGPIGGSMPAISGTTGASVATLPTMANFTERQADIDLLHKWMNDPRVNSAWGVAGPKMTQVKFLEDSFSSRHSFPVIGCFDGKPFGYFEIYWVKEDKLGRLLGGEIGNYTRGLHVLVGENDFRGPHRVKVWLTALVHYCWLADMRTETVMLEPRVDNTKFIDYLKDNGFYKQGEISFPHKQSAVMKIDRDSFTAPAI